VRLTRQVQDLRASVHADIRPLLLSLSTASTNVVRVTELAVNQMQRVDRLFNDVALRVDDATRLVQATLLAPLREGRALLAAVGAALGALRDMKPPRDEPLPTDDDALFIG
jgi:transcription termination factor Rho